MLLKGLYEWLFPSPNGEMAPTEGSDLTISLGCTSPLQPKSDSSSNAIDVEKGEKLLKPSAQKGLVLNNKFDENCPPKYQAWKPSGVFGEDETSNHAVVASATAEAEDPPIVVHSTAEANDEATISSQPLPMSALRPLVESPKVQEGRESDEEVSTDNPYHRFHHDSCESSSVECYYNKEHFLCYKCPVCLLTGDQSSNKEIRFRISKYNEGSNQLIFEEFASVKLDPTTGQLAVITNLGYWSVLNMTLLRVLQSNNVSVQVTGIENTEPATYLFQFLPTDETERSKRVARSLCSKFIEELNAVAETAELLSLSMKVPPLARPGSSIPLRFKLPLYTTYHPNALKK